MSRIDAAYFDGRSARRHAVTLELAEGRLLLRGDGILRSEALHDLRVSEPMGAAPRIISFPGGGTCEVRDHAAFDRLLHASGHRDSAVVRWQFDPRRILVALLLTLAAGLAAWSWGLPWAARAAAGTLPESVLQQVGAQVLESLDGQMLQPTRLPEADRQRITGRFRALADTAAPGVRWTLHFRSGRIGANALALPSGDIVITDALVKLAGSDDHVAAVLAHELGHVVHRHGMQAVLQGTAVGLFTAWFLGDFGSVLASAPAMLAQLQYARGLELEADDYGATVLRANGLSPRLLADMLERLQRQGRPDGEPGAADGPPAYLSTHPDSDERIRRLRSAG